jgi:hypothetical protein
VARLPQETLRKPLHSPVDGDHPLGTMAARALGGKIAACPAARS